jgi:hypothetical protein
MGGAEMMLCVTAALPLAGCLTPQSAQSTGTDAMQTQAIGIQSPGGSIPALAAEVGADLQLPSGRIDLGVIVAVYEPKSRLFWWGYELRNPSVITSAIARLEQRSTLFLTDAKLVSFAVDGRFLSIREGTERVDSLQQGVDRAQASLQASLGELEHGTKEWFTRVDLSALGAEFFLRPARAATLEPSAITAVVFAGGQWRVSLRGLNGETAVVTLDGAYSLVGVKRQ